MALKFRVDLYDSKKKIKSTHLSRAHSFHLYIKEGKGPWIRATDERLFFPDYRDKVADKKYFLDTFKAFFDEEYSAQVAQKERTKAQALPPKTKSRIIRKKTPKLGDLVPGYPPLDPPRKVDAAERKMIRGQARLKLMEDFNIQGPEAEAIIKAMFSAFSKNLPLIPKLMEEFMLVYYLKHQGDKRAHVKRLLTGREVSTEINERPWLKGKLSQIDTLLKLSMVKVERESKYVDKATGEEFEEVVTTDHLFAKVVATYRGNMEMSTDDLTYGSAWRDEVFDAVIMDIINVFQGFVDNGVFEFSKRPEYIIRIICPLFDSNYEVKENLKMPSGQRRHGLGISLNRTHFANIKDVKRHLERPQAERSKLKNVALEEVSLFDRVKSRLRNYLQLNQLNTFAITGFTIERLIYE